MANTMIVPTAIDYQNILIGTVSGLKQLGIACDEQTKRLSTVSEHIESLSKALSKLDKKIEKAESEHDEQKKALFLTDSLIPVMNSIREHCDALEELVPDQDWPLPKYREMLFIM